MLINERDCLAMRLTHIVLLQSTGNTPSARLALYLPLCTPLSHKQQRTRVRDAPIRVIHHDTRRTATHKSFLRLW